MAIRLYTYTLGNKAIVGLGGVPRGTVFTKSSSDSEQSRYRLRGTVLAGFVIYMPATYIQYEVSNR